jgi:hypothetical protein
MDTPALSAAASGFDPASGSHGNAHDWLARLETARRLSLLLDGRLIPGQLAIALIGPNGTQSLYHIPRQTLSADEAKLAGISGPQQLYGGVVPYPFVATKAISHGLIADAAHAPDGWSSALGTALKDCVLRGFTAFNLADAKTAGRLLLDLGPVRIKQVEATAGLGQEIVSTPYMLDAALDNIDPELLRHHGIVIEENLAEALTYSIGLVHLPNAEIAYWGTQRLTQNNHGLMVYGGSDLHVVKGGYERLLQEPLAEELRAVIMQARHYEQSCFNAYSGLYASRRNYDVIAGTDHAGRYRTAVLEQSWRAGGATGAEIAAFELFARDPERQSAHCATFEIYGKVDAAPPGASIYYSGVDPVTGPLTKFAVVKDEA